MRLWNQIRDAWRHALRKPEPSVAAMVSQDNGPIRDVADHVALSSLWDGGREQILAALWGKGVSQPADSTLMREWVKTFGLDKTKTVLDIQAGTGGLARHIAATYGAYVEGLEEDEEQAVIGATLSQQVNLSRQASVSVYDPESFAWPRHVDLALMRPLLYRIHDKDRFLDALAQCLKVQAPLAMLDFTVESATNPAIAIWAKEDGAAQPWSRARVKAALEKRSLTVRIVEDITEAYRHEILQGLCAMTRKMESLRLSPRAKQILVREVRPWVLRADALEKGLNVTRFYASRIRVML